MPENLKDRAQLLLARSRNLREYPMLQRAEQALLLAEDTAALLADIADKLDALTPFQDEVY